MTVIIKDWFAGKIELPYGFALWNRELEVEKETEKAYYGAVEIETVDGEYSKVWHVWVPKKCTMTCADAEEEQEKFERAMRDGLKYNEKLVEFAKANGIKGIRTGLRTVTLIAKIEAAGFTVPARA
jgi:hypothetical protein